MSFANFYNDGDFQHANRSEINGPRPSPLKINKGSHVIHKASSSSFINKMTIKHEHPQRQQPHQPVIIYAHSPKIIYTHPRDFMALVQKLTGLSRSSSYSEDIETTAPSARMKVDEDNNVKKPDLVSMISHDDNESCSALTDETHGEDVQVTSSSDVNRTTQFFADIPLFTPNSANFFCSPQAIYRYSESNKEMGTSPSVLEFMKGLPEY